MNNKLKLMIEGGKKLAQIKQQLANMVKPGIKLIQIDQQAEKLLLATGGEPAFKKVKNYSWSTCLNVNDGVVHGIPNQYVIKNTDLISIDVGLYYKGYYTDTSTSVVAGHSTPEIDKLLQIGEQSLNNAIKVAKLGNRIWHISHAIQETLKSAGYSATKELSGHGVGKELHEKPLIPCFTIGSPDTTPLLELEQTIAIEAIYTIGSPSLITEADGWTISTRDGKLAGLFEETIAITENGPIILTD